MNRENPQAGAAQKTIWSFDLGKASIGEAVRVENFARFLHRASLLIPPELALRGPTTKTGSPANRYRAWRTREAHEQRTRWLSELWIAAGMKPLARRRVEETGGETHIYFKNVRGKKKSKERRAKTEWQLAEKGDARLEREFAGADEPLHTSCLLRIALLRGGNEPLSEWQIYKALWSAIQKRGYAKVPWEKESKGEKTDAQVREDAENERAGERWKQFLHELQKNGCGEECQRPCYFDAYCLKLWNPAKPEELSALPTERPVSTQEVSFPGHCVERELIELATRAASLLKCLDKGAAETIADYKTRTLARIEKANAYRRERNEWLRANDPDWEWKQKKPLHVPAFKHAACSFAELFVYGPAGKFSHDENKRPIASHVLEERKDTGLRPGTPTDWNAALGQRVARFDNRLRGECAILGKCGKLKAGLSTCRNTSKDVLNNPRGDDDPRLLPAQVIFLLKLKDLSIEEKAEAGKQRKLRPEEIEEIFNERKKTHAYYFKRREWSDYCDKKKWKAVTVEQGEMDKTPAGADGEDEGDTAKFFVAPASTEGRCRFSRPALRLLREMILSGMSGPEFKKKLLDESNGLAAKVGVDVLKEPPLEKRMSNEGNEYEVFKPNGKGHRPWVLTGQLDIFDRMRPDNPAEPATWEDLFIPSRSADFEMGGKENDEERGKVIQALIGQEKNPIVRHRLDTFHRRLQILRELHGTPKLIAIELVRDNLDNSWIGKKDKEKIKTSRDTGEANRKKAKKDLESAKLPVTEKNIRKYLLWVSQGGQCLYGEEKKAGECVYLATGLSLMALESYQIDHIVSRALGGPDAFSNLILTTAPTNRRKGDRTPYQWFRDRGFEDWEAYRNRVKLACPKIGKRKARLLVDSQAQKLVERYTPLHETAWIARHAAVIANVFFGWKNGVDENKTQRVFTFAGGLTARIRRQYFLNSLTGPDATATLPNSETGQKEAEQKAEQDRISKDRADHRHHALDAMVLNFLAEQPMARDRNREEEFRFAALKDAPPFSSNDLGKVALARKQIEELSEQYKKLREKVSVRLGRLEREVLGREMDSLQEKITKKREEIGKLHQRRNWKIVRDIFRDELWGRASDNSDGVLPRWLHFPKAKRMQTHLRGAWVLVENEKKAMKATVENLPEAFLVNPQPVKLMDFGFLPDRKNGGMRFIIAHARRQANAIAQPTDDDGKVARKAILKFLHDKTPDAEAWRKWCISDGAPKGIKPKKGETAEPCFKLYKLEERRTTRIAVASLPLPGTEEDTGGATPSKKKQTLVEEWNVGHFHDNIARLVEPPPRREKRGKKTKVGAVASNVDDSRKPKPNEKLRAQLRQMEQPLAEFYGRWRDVLGTVVKKTGKNAKRNKRKRGWFFRMEERLYQKFQLKPGQTVWLEVAAESEKDDHWRKSKLRNAVLQPVPAYSRDTALKKIRQLSDPWARFQLRTFLRTEPELSDWRNFCKVFTQVRRKELSTFLEGKPTKPEQFVEFYGDLMTSNKTLCRITHLQKATAGSEFCVDVSKDQSGIYAEAKNRGYVVVEETKPTKGSGTKRTYRAVAIPSHRRWATVMCELHRNPDMKIRDKRPWRTNMLLQVKKAFRNGGKDVVAGFYYFSSVSNQGATMSLRPLTGGTKLEGISVDKLLRDGELERHEFKDEVEGKK